jgi:hypothetical protein
MKKKRVLKKWVVIVLLYFVLFTSLCLPEAKNTNTLTAVLFINCMIVLGLIMNEFQKIN